MWVGRESAATRSLATQLEAARDEGLENLAKLSEQYASRYALTTAECIEYLSVNLRFTMGQDEMQGLRLFYEKSLDFGIIPRTSQPDWSIISPSTSPQLVSI
jgi:predicted solute-binding protein